MVVVYTASRAIGRNGIDPNTELILNTYPSVEGGYNAVMDIVSSMEKFVPSTGHDTIFLNNGFIVNVYRTTESGEKRYVHTYSTQTLYERSLKGKPIDFTVLAVHLHNIQKRTDKDREELNRMWEESERREG